jgi:catechol 2,3-dioxygenase-like lactoylglutathione lyase family enzyme
VNPLIPESLDVTSTSRDWPALFPGFIVDTENRATLLCMHQGGLVMELGAFSVSLSVKDLAASKDFYEALGFEQIGGAADDNWLILKNGNNVIGLFQGMFEQNVLTFNPGWDQQGNETDTFMDVREIQKALKSHGVSLASEADETTQGPASLMVIDPDGNPILIDQHR